MEKTNQIVKGGGDTIHPILGEAGSYIMRMSMADADRLRWEYENIAPSMGELERMMRSQFLHVMTTEAWEDMESTHVFDIVAPWMEKYPDREEQIVKIAEAAQKWCEKVRNNGHIFQMKDDFGQKQRFISENSDGLHCALSQLGIMIRYNLRSKVAEVRTRKGDWTEMDDITEGTIRDVIRKTYSFARHDPTGRPRIVPAKWSQCDWNIVFNAVLGSNMVDPFIDWLDRLPKWDETERLDRWLEDCGFTFKAPVEDGFENLMELVRWASASILIIAVRRAMEPGLKHDTIPVLVGPQACGKSTAVQWLIPKENRKDWFSDSLRLSSDDKKRIEAMMGAVIVEVAEMTGATTAEIENLRAFVSRTNDRIRLSYRRNPENIQRVCSMVGTANGHSILPNDPTGNRRFVSITITSGNPETVRNHLDATRNQLWAEALHRAKKRESCHFPDHLAAAREAINEEMRSKDAILEDEVEEFLRNKIDMLEECFTAKECAYEIGMSDTEKDSAKLSGSDVARLARIFEKNRCKPQRKYYKGAQRRVWVLPEQP